MIKNKSRTIIFLSVILIWSATVAQDETAEPRVYDYAEDNHQCFKCHGQKTFHYYNENLEQDHKERMNPYFIVDSVEFYESNHWNFSCTDCHSYDYNDFPHSGELRMEEKLSCLVCHEGDEEYADFHFERIDEEFHMSVHSTKHHEDFTCWMCHNPHSYKISFRDSENLLETIQYDNAICLSCHADINKYQLMSDIINPNLIDKHDWLPNQALHFLNVRCIECHAELKEDMMIAHNIQPKEKAVKLCVECHSANSLLLASLYKYEAQERRSKLGFVNAAILNNSYIIGANRNYYLNLISLVLFGMVIFGIGIHATLRIIKK